jgi:hypothetical protein
MTHITNIRNPVYNSEATPPSFLSRAAALFKRDLPYRFLNLINCQCKVPRPRGDRSTPEYREQAFLRKLSKGRMEPLDAMLGLVRLTEIQGYKPFGKLALSTYQAQRMLDNLSQKSIPVLSQHIEEIEKTLREKDAVRTTQQADHLRFLKQLRDNHKYLAEKLMACAGYEQEFLAVGDDDKVSALDSALTQVWLNIPKGEEAPYSPSGLFQKKIVQYKDVLRGLKGTKGQKNFAKNLKSFRKDFSKTNEISTSPLSKMLTQAMRTAGLDHSDDIVQERMEQLAGIPKRIQARLLPPLLEAMSDVVDGVGSARSDLAQALRDIRGAIEEMHHNITVLDDMVAAIKIRNASATDQQFEEAAYERLTKFPKNQLRYLMVHFESVKSSEKAELVQNALRRLADIEVLDTIDGCFQDYSDKNWDAALAEIAGLDDNRLAIIAAFFDRNPWIPDFFQNLAVHKESAVPLAWIIHGVNQLSHRQLGLTTPTSLSEAQKSDRARFVEICDRNGGQAWRALHAFFDVSREELGSE